MDSELDVSRAWRELAALPSSAPVTLRAPLAATFYLFALAVLLESGRRSTASTATIVYCVVVASWALISLVALRRRPDDPRARMLGWTGIVVTLTLLTPLLPADPAGFGWRAILAALRWTPHLLGFAVFLHTAALIPRPHPLLRRWPGLLTAHYALGLGLALYLTLASAVGGGPLVPAGLSVLELGRYLNLATYLWGGMAGLALLGSAALPDLFAGSAFLAWIEPVTILIVPIAFFVSIFGFRLFDLGVLLRRGLIYGLTSGALIGFLYALVVAAGVLAEDTLGLRPRSWQVLVVLVAAGAAFQPLLRRTTAAVDRLLFPEKVALAELLRTTIPELAAMTDIDSAADRLAARLTDNIGLTCAAVLLADESFELYRVRALAGQPRIGAAEAVLTADQLMIWPDVARRRPFRRAASDGGPPESGELAQMLDLLQAATLVPMALKDKLVGLLVLGPVRSGAHFDSDDLARLEVLAHQTAAMLENARLHDLATNDPLTGLARRQVFEQQLALELARARRSFHPFAVALADVDDFKAVNDAHGHLAGDRVLRAVAEGLGRDRRSVDLVCRYGGEEFAILLLDTDADGARVRARRLLEQIDAVAVALPAGGTIGTTVSIGLHMVEAHEVAQSPEEILRLADLALYRAKRAGKNRVEE